MRRAISLREDFNSRQLRHLARESTESNQTRRLFWHWLSSMMAAAAVKPLLLAALVCKSFVTGCCVSMQKVRQASLIANRRVLHRS